jgi:hypothetical protein
MLLSGALVALVLAAPASSAKTNVDSVVGSISVGSQTVEMNAQDTRFGVRGTWAFVSGTSYAGEVTALLVDGQTAVACGTVTSSSNPAAVGQVFHQYVNDTGGKEQFDRSQTFFYPAGTACTAPAVYAAAGAGIVNTGGQWHVHDN